MSLAMKLQRFADCEVSEGFSSSSTHFRSSEADLFVRLASFVERESVLKQK